MMGDQQNSEIQFGAGRSVAISTSHPKGMSLTDIVISSSGFDHNLQDTLFDKDPVQQLFVDDLDQNGYDELYIITEAAGSGSYGHVIGYASNRDKSLSMIHMPDVDPRSDDFEGYRGNDQFSIEDHQLIRIFPVYRNIDSNNAPSGGKRRIVYDLSPGEAMWQLTISKSEHIPG
jgi:hypothetical protein